MYWLDRKDHKEKFKKWRSLDYNYITFNISDEQELKDIENCFTSHLQKDFLIGSATLNSEHLNSKFDILQSLAYELGGKSKFINFYNVLNNLGKSDNVYNIHLEVGTHIKGETYIDDVKRDAIISGMRLGLTFGLPINANHSLKFTAASGIRFQEGGDFDAIGIASGIYIYELKTDSFVQSRRMWLLR